MQGTFPVIIRVSFYEGRVVCLSELCDVDNCLLAIKLFHQKHFAGQDITGKLLCTLNSRIVTYLVFSYFDIVNDA